MEGFPPSENWRLFIDGYRQAEGKWAFDSGAGAEKGFYSAMQGSWDRMMDTLGEPLSTKEVLKIHDYCVGRGEGQQEVEGVVIDSDYRRSKADFGLASINQEPDLGNVTKEGAKEFIQALMSDSPPPVAMAYSDPEKGLIDFVPDKNRSLDENADDFMQALESSVGAGARLIANGDAKEYTKAYIKEYNKEIKHAQTDDEKMLAIAKCVASIERLHPFHDGNCRTMVILTNKLLLQNNLSPTILKNPNQIDMFSTGELVDEIKKGQKVFQSYKIDGAQNSLESLNATSVNDNISVNKAIVKNISVEPLQAMAQLGKLYADVKKGKVHLQHQAVQHSTGKTFGSMFHLHKKQQTNSSTGVMKTENIVLAEIQGLYQSNIDKLTDMINSSHTVVDDLKDQKASAQDKVDSAIEFVNAEQDHAQKKILTEAVYEAQGDVEEIGRDLDRAEKAEQWFVDRLEEIQVEHKELLTEHTSGKKQNTLTQDIDIASKLASRGVKQPEQEQEQEQERGPSFGPS